MSLSPCMFEFAEKEGAYSINCNTHTTRSLLHRMSANNLLEFQAWMVYQSIIAVECANCFCEYSIPACFDQTRIRQTGNSKQGLNIKSYCPFPFSLKLIVKQPFYFPHHFPFLFSPHFNCFIFVSFRLFFIAELACII